MSVQQTVMKWLVKDIGWYIVFPFSFAGLGKYFDNCETEYMTRYRDRSALYGRPPPPEGEKEIPSWP